MNREKHQQRNSHQHAAESLPQSGSGYAVCSCGATQRIENGRPIGKWHTCALCTHAWGLPTSPKVNS